MEFISVLFDTVWELFSIKWPGFNFSIGTAIIAASLAVVGLRIIGKALGISFSTGGLNTAGGNNTSIAIPEERKNDVK